MTLEEYRINHSMLIERYQWIEHDLEELYAVLSEDPFYEALQEIERDSIGGVLREIRAIECQQNIVVLSEAEYETLDQIRERRNFWSHKCYTEPCDKFTGVPENGELLLMDLQKAQTIQKWLREIKDLFMTER